MSKQVESSVNMAGREFSIGCLGVGKASNSIYFLILSWALLARSDIISKFVLWTLGTNTDMLLEMM